MLKTKDAHCSYCGARYPEGLGWPRACDGCGGVIYRNPIPVAVALVPAAGGLLCVRRNIEPGKGRLALPGGYIDFGETWQEACRRELIEETGLVIDAEELRIFEVASAPNGTLLIFGLARERSLDFLEGIQPSEETMECVLVREPIELAFPLHTRMMAAFFQEPTRKGE